MESLLSQSIVSITDCNIECNIVLFFFSVAGTPTGVTVSRTGYTSVLISWTAPSSSPPAAGYEVFYQSSAGDSSRLSAGNTSSTEFTLAGLTLGETYSIFVVAFGEEGAPVFPSSRSNTAMIVLREFISNVAYYTKIILFFLIPL